MLSLTDLIIEKHDKMSQLNWDDKFYIMKLHNINRRYNTMIRTYRMDLIKQINK
jgi:hypothetical protein